MNRESSLWELEPFFKVNYFLFMVNVELERKRENRSSLKAQGFLFFFPPFFLLFLLLPPFLFLLILLPLPPFLLPISPSSVLSSIRFPLFLPFFLPSSFLPLLPTFLSFFLSFSLFVSFSPISFVFLSSLLRSFLPPFFFLSFLPSIPPSFHLCFLFHQAYAKHSWMQPGFKSTWNYGRHPGAD